MKYIIIIFLFCSCMSQRKVTSWLNNHPTEAAGYCADRFPIKEVTDTLYLVDSSDYAKAYEELVRYTDSLTQVALDRRPDTVLHNSIAYITVPPSKKLIDSIRASVAVQLKRSLKPCIDSSRTIIRVQENTARVKELEGISRDKDRIIIDQVQRIKWQVRWIWWFWILVAINGAYVLLKVRKIIPF